MPFTAKRILITGADGFLGRNLANYLRKGYPEWIISETDLFECDLRDSVQVRNMFDCKPKPSIVVHLAAAVGRLPSEVNASDTISNNAIATANVARQVAKIPDCQMVYFSTSEIYGDGGERPWREHDSPRLPANLYGLTKRWGEEIVQLYCPERLQILRPTMPYGPGVVPAIQGKAALPTFLWKAHNRLPIEVHAGAERSWIYITDFIRAVADIIIGGKRGSLAGIYNVGRDDNPISMLELAHKCCNMAGVEGDKLIRLMGTPALTTTVKRVSCRKMVNDIGFIPEVDLHEGLKLTYEWAKQFDKSSRPIAC